MHENPTRERLHAISGTIVDAAYGIHSRLGPGLLESVYHVLLAKELTQRGLGVERHKPIVCEIDGVVFENAFVPDLIVERAVVVEVKAVEKLAFVHERQLLTYLKLLDYRVGLLLNFGAPLIKEGIRRLVNKL
jgi:iron complex transport system substrate-binding protein